MNELVTANNLRMVCSSPRTLLPIYFIREVEESFRTPPFN